MDPLLLPGNTFLEERFGQIKFSKNSDDVTVTSFLNQSQQNVFISFEILGCSCVLNLSKIGLLMFPWQHILDSVLMQNQAIQLSNDFTVTLFLNQCSQNFELFLEMIMYKILPE